ncbi:MAG: hypothetical protein HUJ80_07020 [Firmicutes bacterium]|nr:hypothetical protein [Bacillota bacterium]
MQRFIDRFQASPLVYRVLYGFRPGRLPNPAALFSRHNYPRNCRKLQAALKKKELAVGGSPQEGPQAAFLLRQHTGGPADELRFGLAPMSGVGCEIMACFNAMLLCGKTPHLPSLIRDFEHRGCSLLGFLGTAPAAVHRRLCNEGLQAELLWAPLYEVGGDESFGAVPPVWEDHLKTHTCVIITFWWPQRYGIHTVMLQKDPSGQEGLCAWNYRGDRDFYHYPSIEKMVQLTGIVPISLITVQ